MKTKTETLPNLVLQGASRKKLEKYIKEHIPFYRFADLCGHDNQQLRTVIERHREKERIAVKTGNS